MELSTREDIDAPAEWVWSQVTDHHAFERLALRRGAEVQRLDRGADFVEGAAWAMKFRFRGKDRALEARVTGVTPPHDWTADIRSGGIDGQLGLEVVPMSRTRTRLIVQATMSARTLSARLMLQSMKLARSGVLSRFRTRVAAHAAELEARYRDQA